VGSETVGSETVGSGFCMDSEQFLNPISTLGPDTQPPFSTIFNHFQPLFKPFSNPNPFSCD